MSTDVAEYNLVTTWCGGMATETRSHSVAPEPTASLPEEHIICADLPCKHGEMNTAPSPQELLLAAFNSCMAAAFISEATRAGVRLSSLEMTTRSALSRGNRSPTPPHPGSQNVISYVIRASGDGSLQQFEKIHTRAIAASPNRWLLAQNLILEGDLILV